jgi:hypothetical protein
MTDPAWSDPLQDLLTEALSQVKGTKRKVTKSGTPYGRSFSKPEDWTFHGQVHLVHKGENVETLIGLFDEFLHSVERGARLLKAATESRDCPRTIEHVNGDHWIPSDRMQVKRETPTMQIELIAPLDLSMGQILHASPVICTAHLSHGGLSLLTLDEVTIFEGNTPREILSLPKGMDVLEGLTEDCKRKVWAAVLIEQSTKE